MTVTINGTSGITTPGVNSTGSNVLGDNVADTLNVGNGAIVTDSSGNVGIGTSSPATNFQIDKATQNVVRLTSGLAATDLIATAAGDGQLRTVGAHPLVFGTNATERMRISSSGNLMIGRTDDIGYRLSVLSSATPQLVARQNSTGGLIDFNYGGSQVGSISTNGSNTTYGTSSDYRLKENIQPMQNALATIAQLNPVTYTWKADGSDGQGFIAHELQAVVPDCVTGEKDAVDEEGKPVYQGIDTSFLVATLTKAIQELTARVEQLEAK